MSLTLMLGMKGMKCELIAEAPDMKVKLIN